MTRRLLLGYLGVTLFVLLALEIPLGIQNQRTERRDLSAKVSHDAMVLAADSEDAVQTHTRRQLDALAATAASASSWRRVGACTASSASAASTIASCETLAVRS